MSSEQIRIAIAESRGRKWVSHPAVLEGKWLKPQFWTLNGQYRPMLDEPNYPEDLNVMASVEQTLSHDHWRIYLGFIIGERVIPKLASMEEFHRAWNATARQRAEAYLKVKGLWKD